MPVEIFYKTMLFVLRFMRLFLRKHKKKIILLLITAMLSIGFRKNKNEVNFLLNFDMIETNNSIISYDTVQSIIPKTNVCPASVNSSRIHDEARYSSKRSLKNLVIMTINSSKELQSDLANLLHSTKIKYLKKYNINDLISTKASVILFQNYSLFQSKLKNTTFMNYLINNKISVISFNIDTENLEKVNILKCKLNEDTILKYFLHTTKYNLQYIYINKFLNLNKGIRNFKTENSKSILQCETSSNITEDILFIDNINGIKHVIISTDNLDDIWLLKPLFMDALRYLTDGEIEISLDRYVQIDIDDIFVGSTGTRMIPNDVYELIKLQDELSLGYFYHDDYKFKFNLGYSGYYYQSGNQNENEADRLLIGKTILTKLSYCSICSPLN